MKKVVLLTLSLLLVITVMSFAAGNSKRQIAEEMDPITIENIVMTNI